ncbi:CPBP family intramembrane glutamic endopeptidase [Mycoplasma suis]|nr:CPBP family intramembrane glutamic endopeptidase [Mycoplasma suis]
MTLPSQQLSSQTSLSTSQVVSSFLYNSFLNGKKASNGLEFSFWNLFLNWTKLFYLVAIGSIFLFIYIKRKDNFQLEQFCDKYLPECKFWLFHATIRPGIDIFSHLAQSWAQNGNREEIKSVFMLMTTVGVFYNTFMYMRSSWVPLKGQLFSLYKDKYGNFDSSRLRYFLGRIFGLLLIEIIVAISIYHVMKLIFPSVEGTRNQEEIENKMSKTENILFAAFNTVMIAPVVEELIYRRALLKIAKFSNIAVVTSSLLFAISHMSVTQETIFHLTVYFVGGMFFALTYKYFRNIWTSITLHSLHNLCTLIIFLVKISAKGAAAKSHLII